MIDIISKNSFTGLKPTFQKHIKPLVYIFGATLASSIYTFWDTILLGFLSNVTAVGYYTASVKLTKLIIPLVIAFGGVLVPRIANHFGTNKEKEAKELITNSYNFILFITIPISMGLILLAPELMLFFSGTQFAQATTTMQIVAVLPILIGFGHLFAFQILIPMGKNKEVFMAMVIGLIINIILNFTLIPLFNDKGAAFSTVVTELVVSSAYLYYVRKSIKINFQFKFIVQSVALSLLFIPIILITRATITNTFLVTVLCISICSLLYFAVQHYIFNNNFVYQIFLLQENKNSHEAEN
jgi:O-antigen/teichoic acid export membrane protein